MDLLPTKTEEPWFDEKEQPRKIAAGEVDPTWSKNDEIVFNQIRRQSKKWEFYQLAFDFINENGVEGDYHEFGCHRARTFRMALIEAKRHFLDMRFHAYDSFEGLPDATTDLLDASVKNWGSGTLSTSEEAFKELIKDSGLWNQNIDIHKGFYDKSLEAISEGGGLSKAALICIDCDLYISAKPVYKFIDKLIVEGTIIYVDDYYAGYKGNPNRGVSKAHKEWEENTCWKLEPYHRVGSFGRSFICYK